MTPIEKRTILIHISIIVMPIFEKEIKEKIFNETIKKYGINEEYIFDESRNKWSIII
jgi:hypothetical protein